MTMSRDSGSRIRMSLRDWLAGQALIGLLQNNYLLKNLPALAYDLADEMLEERRKHGEPE